MKPPPILHRIFNSHLMGFISRGDITSGSNQGFEMLNF
jgi:hypothetical protein